jgi:hypothetical protein
MSPHNYLYVDESFARLRCAGSRLPPMNRKEEPCPHFPPARRAAPSARANARAGLELRVRRVQGVLAAELYDKYPRGTTHRCVCQELAPQLIFCVGPGECKLVKPPFCILCRRECSDGPAAASVRFRDYKPLPEACIGHPHGLEWFCPDHAPAARELADLDSAAAIGKLCERFGYPRPGEVPPLDCERCGQPISARRRFASPTATRCLACQIEIERSGSQDSPAQSLHQEPPPMGLLGWLRSLWRAK